ncbi:MAG: hypothetical protein LBS07_01635 [Prevotellaceae bacterium]|nr:hypothetical protein [Prevotellaceae bacterium]
MILVALIGTVFTSCNKDDDEPIVQKPVEVTFSLDYDKEILLPQVRKAADRKDVSEVILRKLNNKNEPATKSGYNEKDAHDGDNVNDMWHVLSAQITSDYLINGTIKAALEYNPKVKMKAKFVHLNFLRDANGKLTYQGIADSTFLKRVNVEVVNHR